MKRCPKCEFLYLDSDQTCDLDGAKLIPVANEASHSAGLEDSVTSRQGWKTFALLVVPGLVFGLILFFVYKYQARHRQGLISNQESSVELIKQSTPEATPSPIETVSPLTAPSPSPSPRALPTRSPSPKLELSSKPVTTGGKEANPGMIIRLHDGGQIVADEAWRTKDGIWYRRNGVVTLLKTSQVKAIEKK